MQTTPEIFDRYEEVRSRLPRGPAPGKNQDISSLLDIAPEATAFVFDAFGVLNVGDTLIPGADVRLDQLRKLGCSIRILTNAASYDRHGAIAKFQRLGLSILDDEIITSRDAALSALNPGLWGVIGTDEDALTDIPHPCRRLEDTAADYDNVDGVLFLSSASWTNSRQEILTRALLANQRPVLIANADLVAPRDKGFSLEPGHYGHLLLDQGVRNVRFFGKPFGEVFDLVAKSLPNVPPERIVMCGDTLHTDILGAADKGWRTVLVTKDGLFRGHDTQPFCERSKLFPNWRLGRI